MKKLLLISIAAVYLSGCGNNYPLSHGGFKTQVTEDQQNNQMSVRTITTVAGNGFVHKVNLFDENYNFGVYNGDNIKATDASLNVPWGVASDKQGNIYIAEYAGMRIRKVDTEGVITTIAGNGSDSSDGNGGLANLARVSRPSNIILDEKNNIYFSEPFASKLRKIDAETNIINIFAGGGPGDFGEGIPAYTALIAVPLGLAMDNNTIYFSEYSNQKIRKVRNIDDTDKNNHIVTTFAGTGFKTNPNKHLIYQGSRSEDNIPATESRLNNPMSLAVDKFGNLYIADTNNNKIRKVDTSGIITTVAGNGFADFSGDSGPASLASLNHPFDLAVDKEAGILYVADTGNNLIRKITGIYETDPEKHIISTVAGDGFVIFNTPDYANGRFNYDNVPALEASLNHPSRIALDHQGNLLISDTGNNRIRKLILKQQEL